MSKRELIERELGQVPDQDLDRLLDFLRALKDDPNATLTAAESSLAKDWSTPQENEAWMSL